MNILLSHWSHQFIILRLSLYRKSCLKRLSSNRLKLSMLIFIHNFNINFAFFIAFINNMIRSIILINNFEFYNTWIYHLYTFTIFCIRWIILFISPFSFSSNKNLLLITLSLNYFMFFLRVLLFFFSTTHKALFIHSTIII